MIIRNRTTKFSGSPTGLPNFFAHIYKNNRKNIWKYNQNDYLYSAFVTIVHHEVI